MTFADLRDQHRGCQAIVIGQGPSAAELPAMTMCVELTVNDGQAFRPDADYTVILDRHRLLVRGGRDKAIFEGRSQPLVFAGSIVHWRRWIEGHGDAAAKAWLERVVTYPAIFSPPAREIADWREGIMPYYGGSPFVACSIAAWLGATRIGVIGLDMSDPERWGEDAKREAASQYRRLWQVLGKTGVELVSLSERNAIHGAIPHSSIGGFAAGQT